MATRLSRLNVGWVSEQKRAIDVRKIVDIGILNVKQARYKMLTRSIRSTLIKVIICWVVHSFRDNSAHTMLILLNASNQNR